MNPTEKALWFIESHLAGAMSLDRYREISGVSRFHMVRAFAAATGFSVMGYMRPAGSAKRRASWHPARPTSSASRWTPVTPRMKRSPAPSATSSAPRRNWSARARCLDNLDLVEPILMDRSLLDHLKPPRFETGGPAHRRPRRTLHCENAGAAIPKQWQRFHQYIGNIPGRVGKVAYGVCFNGDDAGNFDYIAGVEVTDFSDLPREFRACGCPSRNTRCSPTPSTSRPSAAPSTRSGITGCRPRA